MAIVVIEGGAANGADFVTTIAKRPRLPKFVDETEYVGGSSPLEGGLHTRASRNGVCIEPMPRRMLGWHQAEAMAKAILRSAEHARKRGAPSHLVTS